MTQKYSGRRGGRINAIVAAVFPQMCKTLMVWACLICLLVAPPASIAAEKDHPGLKDGLYAEMETTKGTILLELFYKRTPLTVTNFAALVNGKMDTDVRQGQKFYDGLTFHRVIADFMIQGEILRETAPAAPVTGSRMSFIPSFATMAPAFSPWQIPVREQMAASFLLPIRPHPGWISSIRCLAVWSKGRRS